MASIQSPAALVTKGRRAPPHPRRSSQSSWKVHAFSMSITPRPRRVHSRPRTYNVAGKQGPHASVAHAGLSSRRRAPVPRTATCTRYPSQPILVGVADSWAPTCKCCASLPSGRPLPDASIRACRRCRPIGSQRGVRRLSWRLRPIHRRRTRPGRVRRRRAPTRSQSR
jgi:hypothetical protein